MARKSNLKRQSAQARAETNPTSPQAESVASPTRKSPNQSNQSWSSGVFLPAMLSGLGLWAASPPLSWGWLAWLAPVGWLLICRRELPVGGRGYFALWISGCVFWLLVLHGIRLAYWPLIFGWLALSLYLAIYIPIFVAVTRVMVWRWKCSLVLAAPCTWLGLELIRSYMLTGYSANTLAHSQAHYPLVIQIVDQLGGGGLSFVMLTVTAALLPWIERLLDRIKDRTAVNSIGSQALTVGTVWALSLMSGTLGYGWWRLDEAERTLANSEPLMRVLLVQENTPSIFDNWSPERNQQAWDAYLELTRQGAIAHGPVELVIWPESTFTANEPWAEQQLGSDLPVEMQREQVDRERLMDWIHELELALRTKANLILDAVRGESAEPAATGNATGREVSSDGSGETTDLSARDDRVALRRPYLLVGCDVLVFRTEKVERLNSALFIDPQGKLVDRYGKMHLVMFGEYIPLGPLLQWLRDLVGLAGMDAGKEVKSFAVGDVRVAPNICFESMMPRVVNGQVRELVSRDESPDVLVNITNDSWFRGSTMLDHHLACSILCAVENRRPMLVAANTGLSAHIDGCGRVQQCSQRLAAQTLLAEPQADGRWGLVQFAGCPLSWICAVMTFAAACAGWFLRKAT